MAAPTVALMAIGMVDGTTAHQLLQAVAMVPAITTTQAAMEVVMQVEAATVVTIEVIRILVLLMVVVMTGVHTEVVLEMTVVLIPAQDRKLPEAMTMDIHAMGHGTTDETTAADKTDSLQ